MNPHVAWRLDLARDLNEHLSPFAGIRAVVVAGSVARGWSDAYSDLEMILYWDMLPDPDTYAAIMAALRASFRYPPAHPGHDSAWLIDGFPVDVWNLTVASAEATMDSVLIDHSVDLIANNVLDTIQACTPLAGNDLIEGWKQRVSVYPEPLTIRFLERYLAHFHLRHLAFAARRDNPTAFYHTLSDIQCSLFLVLLALNGAWFPTYKWLYQALGRMPVAPPGVGPRFRQMYRESPVAATDQLRDVLAETLTIVETTVPHLERHLMERERYELHLKPAAYERPGVLGGTPTDR